MHSLQKMSFSVLLCGVLVASSILFVPTDSLGALPKKKLEIIIGGDNFCKDNKDCAGDSFCNMTSHICITCPKPFEWVGGTQCVCPSGTVPNADNTDCVECMTDENCQALKGNLHWVCDTDMNTCACMSGLHEVGGECVCDNPNKTPDEDGNCICQLSQSDCSTSDFTGTNDCKCCPTDTPKWDGLECRTCADVDRTKPYYNPTTHTCEECLEDSHCENEQTCSADKQCVCELTQADCPTSDFTNAEQCACCPVDKPKWDGTTSTCKACSEIDATKPYYNPTTHTCEECLEDSHCENEQTCSADKKCVCELTQADCPTSDFTNAEQCACCPADKPVWDTVSNQCIEDTCYGRMIAAGFDDKLFKISGELITYNGDMTVSQDLDISKCDLMVKGELRISNGTTSVRNVEVSNSERHSGIILSADTTLTVGGNVISTLRNAETAASGIYVSSNSTITAQGDITVTVSSSYNGQLYGIFSRGTITAQGDITATVSSSYGSQLSGINSSGTITAQGDIIGKSNSTGDGTQNNGIVLGGGTITAHGNITGTAEGGTGEQLTGIDVKKGATLITIAGDVIGQSNATEGTQSEGIMLRGGTITAHGNIIATAMGEYGSQIKGISANESTITTYGNITGTAEGGIGDQLTGIYANESTITAYGNITATAKGGGDFIRGISASDGSIITSENGTITGDSWSEYGSSLCGIYLLKDATIIAEMGNIKGTAKGSGTALEGVAAYSGSIRAEGDIVGKTTKTEGSYDVSVYSDASVVAKNIYYCNEIRGEVQGNKIQKCL